MGVLGHFVYLCLDAPVPLRTRNLNIFEMNPSIHELSVHKTYPFVDLIPVHLRT